MGVDPLTGDALIGVEPGGTGNYEVFEFNDAGQPLPALGQNSFGAGFMSSFGPGSPGIAVNSASRTIYVADPSNNVVDMFNPIVVQDVSTGPAVEIKETSAVLTGEVNPLGVSEVSDYFEYGETKAYGASIPAPPGDSDGSGLVFTAVTPEKAEGLMPGTTYHYRLDATDGLGFVAEGEDRIFTTPPEAPKVDETPATVSNITTESAVFHGTVQPGNGTTTYHFIYGTTGAYGYALPAIGIGSGFSPVGVEQAAGANLKPHTTYHFALVAENAGGTTIGHDHTFRTLSNGSPPTTPPVLTTGPATAVTQTEATIAGILFPEGLPTSYALELGAAAGSYETRVFGNVVGEPGEAIPTATFTNLRPGTTYHYRLVASNAAGTSEGPDRTFTTALFAPSIAIPVTPLLVPFVFEGPPPVPRCHRGVRSAQVSRPPPEVQEGLRQEGRQMRPQEAPEAWEAPPLSQAAPLRYPPPRCAPQRAGCGPQPHVCAQWRHASRL